MAVILEWVDTQGLYFDTDRKNTILIYIAPWQRKFELFGCALLLIILCGVCTKAKLLNKPLSDTIEKNTWLLKVRSETHKSCQDPHRKIFQFSVAGKYTLLNPPILLHPCLYFIHPLYFACRIVESETMTAFIV